MEWNGVEWEGERGALGLSFSPPELPDSTAVAKSQVIQTYVSSS